MKKLFFSGIVMGLLLLVAPARAAESMRMQQGSEAQKVEPQRAGNMMEDVEERQADRQENRQEQMEWRCDLTEQRINTRVARYENNTQRHQNQYQRMQTWMNALVTRLQADGIDTSELETDMGVFNQQVQQFGSDVEAYMASLRQSQGYACGQSEGAFMEQLGQSRDLLAVVREDSLNLREYWQVTLRPLISELVAANQ